MQQEDHTYYRIVDEAFNSPHRRLISNGKPEHAAYLIRKFFEKAEATVRLFSGRLSREIGKPPVPVFADPAVIDAARRFLQKKGTDLKVVVADELDRDDGGSHPFLDAIRDEAKWGFLRGKLEVRRAPEEARRRPHFLLMDDSALRFETDSEKVKAVVVMNDRGKLFTQASDSFDRLFGESTAVCAIQ